MSSILEELRKTNMVKASDTVAFSNAGAASQISKDFIEKFKNKQAGGSDDSILKELREKNMQRTKKHLDFDNSLAQSDISRRFNAANKAKEPIEQSEDRPCGVLQRLSKAAFDTGSSKIHFDNSLATSDISREYIEKYKVSQFESEGHCVSVLEDLRKKNIERTKVSMDFDNSLAQSDISRKFNAARKAKEEIERDPSRRPAGVVERLKKAEW